MKIIVDVSCPVPPVEIQEILAVSVGNAVIHVLGQHPSHIIFNNNALVLVPPPRVGGQQ